MIHRVHFENFQSLGEVTLELGRITALVGPNGCGKSSVLLAMHLLSRLGRETPEAIFEGLCVPERLIYRGEPGTIIVAVQHALGEVKLAIDLAEGTAVRFRIDGDPRAVSARYVRLDPKALMQRSAAGADVLAMEPAGHHLASTLHWMERTSRDELALIAADLRRLLPGTRRIHGERFAIEFDDGSELPVGALGDGAVLALGLLAVLREPGRPRLVLIDDLDRGLHLSAQTQLVTMIHEAMVRDPGLQVVCTTHSAFLLNLLQPSEVRVLALDTERRTHTRPLTDHPEFDKWSFGAQTGELWVALGESWVLEVADRRDP